MTTIEQYIILQKGDEGYHIDFFPPLESGEVRIEGKQFTLEAISAENIDHSIIAINGLYENRNNSRYLKSLNINFDKLYTPYYLDISRIEKNSLNNKNKIFTTSLDKFCQIRISRFNDCGDVKKIKLFFDNKHIDEIFYTGYDYSLNLLKIESN